MSTYTGVTHFQKTVRYLAHPYNRDAGTNVHVVWVHVDVCQPICLARRHMKIKLIMQLAAQTKYDVLVGLYCVIDNVIYAARTSQRNSANAIHLTERQDRSHGQANMRVVILRQ